MKFSVIEWQLYCTAPEFRAELPLVCRICLLALQSDEKMLQETLLIALSLLIFKPVAGESAPGYD